MATIVRHFPSNRLFILVGSGFGAFRTTQASALLGNLHHEITEGKQPMLCVCDAEGCIHWLPSPDLKIESIDGQNPQGIFENLPALPEPIVRKLSKGLLKRLRLETGAEVKVASKNLLHSLAKHNVSGTTLEYFEAVNIQARKTPASIHSASRVLRMMDTIAPNCEVWQHGYIAFARDSDGRAYCFDQNTLNYDGNAQIIRIDHPVGEEISLAKLQDETAFVASDLAEFFELFLAGELKP